jgi:Carboxypeptidase regulatory-like domain
MTKPFRGLTYVVAFFFGLGPSALRAQCVVTGTVTDRQGIRAAHALLDALPLPTDSEATGVAGDRPNPWIAADDQGIFSMNLPPGRYRIRAKDEANGYPDPTFMLSSDSTAKFPEVLLRRGDEEKVQVVLGLRGGILDGEVRDSNSGLPILRAKVAIRDKINPSAYVEVFSDAKGHFQFTVPAKPVSVSVTATGYESAPAEEITLSGGQHRALDFNLKKH